MSLRFLALSLPVALFALLAGSSQAQTAAVMYPTGNISATGYVQAGGVSATNGYFSGSVGIGTSSPTYQLHVAGVGQYTGNLTDTGAKGASLFLDDLSGAYASGGALYLSAGGKPLVAIKAVTKSGNRGDMVFSVRKGLFDTYLTNVMQLTENGNLGLGTNTPSTTLHVSGTIRMADGGEACDANRTGAIKYTGGDFYICRNASAWESLTSIGGGAGATTDRIISGTTQAIAYSNTSLSLVTAGTERLVIGTSGEVGIGVQPTVGTALSVNGYVGVNSGDLALNSGYKLRWGGSNNYITGYNTQHYLAFITSNTEAMRIVSSGYVGIGTNSPSATLHVFNGSIMNSLSSGRRLDVSLEYSSINFYGDGGLTSNFVYHINRYTSGNHISFMPGGLGKVGINISVGVSPSTALHVSGTIRMADGGEACDTKRLGAIKYASGAFYICQNTSNDWEPLATTGASATTDRITSSSQAGVIANSTGYISLTTGGVTGTAYFTPASVLVNAGVSSTGPISGTTGYFSGAVTSNAGVNGTSGSFRDWLQIATGNTASLCWGADLKTRITGNANSSYISIVTSATEAMRIVSTGNVGIGTTTPAYPLDISGTAQATQFLNTSDRRLKQDIKPLAAGLEDLRKLRPVTFRWTARPNEGEKLGLIAQEVEQVIPQAVKTASDPSGTKAIDYNALVPLLIHGLQQQQEEIDTLKAQLKAMNDNIRQLQGR